MGMLQESVPAIQGAHRVFAGNHRRLWGPAALKCAKANAKHVARAHVYLFWVVSRVVFSQYRALRFVIRRWLFASNVCFAGVERLQLQSCMSTICKPCAQPLLDCRESTYS